jgi:glycosyltransferase involved in cell wall biosynthesis
MMPARKLLSIVIPLLNEEQNLRPLHQRLSAVASTLDRDLEIIFVDDGSNDQSLAVLKELSAADPRVRSLSLSRNFGSHGAILAGFSHARGDHAVILTADLQDPPELLPELLAQCEAGYDVVWGSREQREDPWLTVAFSEIYNRMMRRLALPNWPQHGFDFVVVSRRVLSVILARQERNTSLFGQILWAGFRQTSVPYKRSARRSGRSKWTLSKKIKLAIDSFVSFSYFPVRLISLLGILFAVGGAGYAAFVLTMRATHGVTITGWASLMVVLLVVGGTQLVMLGIIGEYLWRTFDETRRRPPFIVAEATGFEDSTLKLSSEPGSVSPIDNRLRTTNLVK